jgi:hypothetical protein
MSIAALNWAFGLRLPYKQKLTLLVLANHADQSGACWPSLTTITRKASLRRQTVLEALADLAEAGALSIQPGNRRRSNRYQLYIGASISVPLRSTRRTTVVQRVDHSGTPVGTVTNNRTFKEPSMNPHSDSQRLSAPRKRGAISDDEKVRVTDGMRRAAAKNGIDADALGEYLLGDVNGSFHQFQRRWYSICNAPLEHVELLFRMVGA